MSWRLDRNIKVGDLLKVLLPLLAGLFALLLWLVEPLRERVVNTLRPEVLSIGMNPINDADPDQPLNVITTLAPGGARKSVSSGKIIWEVELLTEGRIASAKLMSTNFDPLVSPFAIALPEAIQVDTDSVRSTVRVTATVSTRQIESQTTQVDVVLERKPDRLSVSRSNYTGVWAANFGGNLAETGQLVLLDRGANLLTGQLKFPDALFDGETIDLIGSRDHGFLQIKGVTKDGCDFSFTDTNIEVDAQGQRLVSQSEIVADCLPEPIPTVFSSGLLQ